MPWPESLGGKSRNGMLCLVGITSDVQRKRVVQDRLEGGLGPGNKSPLDPLGPQQF